MAQWSCSSPVKAYVVGTDEKPGSHLSRRVKGMSHVKELAAMIDCIQGLFEPRTSPWPLRGTVHYLQYRSYSCGRAGIRRGRLWKVITARSHALPAGRAQRSRDVTDSSPRPTYA